ncbi:MAG: nucleotidyltransferase domain-containing protein [Sulfolobales archaeon]
MGGRYLEVIEERVRKRDLYVKKAQEFAECAVRKLRDSAVLIYGSVSRGDFNEWSDIDVLIVTREAVPQRPTERLDVLYDCTKENPLVEPVVITLDELRKLLAKKNPLVVEALRKGIVLIDRLGLRDLISTLDC